MRNIKLQNAVLAAEKVIKEEKLELPIDLSELAQRHDILLHPKPIVAKGVSGMLLRYGESFTIVYATHIKSEGFQRFSIAHELGHYFLPSHPENVFQGGKNIHESHAGFCSDNQIELEADHFAAGLLMPRYLFVKESGKFLDGLTAIENLAKICKTSIVASAIRYVGLTDATVAVVISSEARVEYSFASDSMRKIKGYTHLKKGLALPRKSLTYNFNLNSLNINQSKRETEDTDFMLWFQADREIMATEEVVGLGSYGKTLTVITADADEVNEDEESKWEEPTFHR
jgi:Zn-dependent peptidase ImmA (M78 family)